jgi:hypothetical protein
MADIMHTNTVYSFEVVCMKSGEWCIMCICKYILLTSSPFCELTSLIRLFLSTHGRNELCSMFFLRTYSFLYPGFLVLWIICWVKPHRMGIVKIWRVAELCCIVLGMFPAPCAFLTEKHDMQTFIINQEAIRVGGILHLFRNMRDLTHISRHKSFPVLNSRQRFLCIFFHLQNVVQIP